MATATVSDRGDWYLHSKKLCPISVDLGKQHLKLKPTGKKIIISLQYKDIIGCKASDPNEDGSLPQAKLHIYCYAKKKPSSRSSRNENHVTLICKGCETEQENYKQLAQFQKDLQEQMALSRNDLKSTVNDRRLLILVNPASGAGEALRICHRTLLPVLNQAGYLHEVVVTAQRGHASSLVQSLQLDQYYGIVVVSGDGLLYEVLNGLMSRRDCTQAIKTPIGIIPGGSGNARCVSINYSAGESFKSQFALASAFLLATHSLSPLDLIVCETSSGNRVVGSLSLTWGIFADVDIESEKLRMLGDARFTVYGISLLMKRRRYEAELSFLPVEEYAPKRRHSTGEEVLTPGQGAMYSRSVSAYAGTLSTAENDRDSASSNVCPQETRESVAVEEETTPVSSDWRQETDGRASLSGVDTPLLPPASDPVPSNWVTIKDTFISVTAHLCDFLDPNTMVAPGRTTDSGDITLMIIRARHVSRRQMFKLMNQFPTGKHVDNPLVELVKVRALRLVPLKSSRRGRTPGHMVVDGEEVEYGPIQAQVLPGSARLMDAYSKRQEVHR